MPMDTCTKRKKIYEEARRSMSKQYKEELEDLRIKNRILVEDNMNLQKQNAELVKEIDRLNNTTMKYPDSFIELLSLYERLL